MAHKYRQKSASAGLKKIGKAVTQISKNSSRCRYEIASKGGSYHYTVRSTRVSGRNRRAG
jgi:hypothetical protein